MRFQDLTKSRFGRLTVLSFAGWVWSGINRRPTWRCLCDCGTEIVVRSSGLKTGDTRSCGCLLLEMMTRPIPNIEVIAADYRDGMSLPTLGDKYNIPRATIRLHLIKIGVTMRKSSEWMASVDDLGAKTRGKKRPPFSEEWKQNISAGRIRWADENAVGESLKPNGYISITRGPNKERPLHRVIFEKVIGRPLLQHEVVHHKDGDKLNNDLANLEIMTASEHARLHRLQEIAAGKQRKRDKRGRLC